MAERVFVNVVGFADEERHALNLLFRISEEQGTPFSVWDPGAPQPPKLALVDGESFGAQASGEAARNADVPLIWVGSAPPSRATRVFQRPIAWPEVVQLMTELFPAPLDLDFDSDLSALDTQPPDTLPPDVPPVRRALIAAADRDERLYLRAKLALSQLTQADEAETAADALELARSNDYVLAVVDFDLPGALGWQFVKQLGEGVRRIPKVIVTRTRPRLLDRLRAWRAGAAGYFAKPLHPAKLHDAFSRV
jgi:CheY-like chemotaxis protein